ncbi:hypothetical protein J699_00422 [Acinetobacter sp. 1000160]|nr:hypothetical protein J522_2639 [Acinetobacter baumannii 146457]EYT23977.1 hypothetical protein J699_00422 [Acinetobacter sp. 1000160]
MKYRQKLKLLVNFKRVKILSIGYLMVLSRQPLHLIYTAPHAG